MSHPLLRKILVSINVNDDRANDLVDAGFERRRVTKGELIDRRDRNAGAAEKIGRDAFRLGRRDDLGRIPDSGRVKLTTQGQNRVSLSRVLEDMTAIGFRMSSAYVEDQAGKSPRFRVWFDREEKPAIELSERQWSALNLHLKRVYDTIFVYDNRETVGSITVNTSAPMSDDVRRGVRDLRIYTNGSTTCDLRE